MVSIRHTKTNNIPDWTQAKINTLIAAGELPAGTTLNDVTLPSDWNDEHTITGVVESLTGIGNISIDNTDPANPVVDGSALVPYTGATGDVDLGAYSLNAASIKVNGTNGAGHIHLKHQASDATSQANSTTIFSDSLGDIKWKNDSAYYTTLKSSSNTADRTYTFPNASGTLALTNDLTPYARLDGTNQPFTGSVVAPDFNGVVLTDAGAGTNYLADDGAYKPIDLSGYVTGATNSTLTKTAQTLGLNLGNANTWTTRQTFTLQTIQPTVDADDVWRLNNAAGTRRAGYSTSKSQFYFAEAAPNSTYGLFYIADVTHSFKPVFRVDKYTWGSLIEGSLATDSPVFNITGGSTFATWSKTNTATAFANIAPTGISLTVRDDFDNYGTWGGYAKGYNNNPAPTITSAAQKRGVSYGFVADAQSNATGSGGAALRTISSSSNIEGIRADVYSGQTSPIFRARTVNNFYDAFITSATDIMTIEADGSIKNDGTNKWIFKGHTGSASVTVDTTQYVTVNIGGTDYKLAVVT